MPRRYCSMIPLLLGERTVGRTALNKLVFFADIALYLRTGHTVSGATHMRLNHGPVPEGITDVRNQLIREGLLSETMREGPFFKQFDYAVSAAVDLAHLRACFTDDELAVIDAVRENLGSKTAQSLTTASHTFEPWKSAEHGFALSLERARTDDALRTWLVMHRVLN